MKQPNCCDSAVDCDDGVPCNINACIANKCRYGPDVANPDCCHPDAVGLNYLNRDDQNDCTEDYCNLNTFVCTNTNQPDEECCFSSAECTDGDPSTLDKCKNGFCWYPPDPAWCDTDADCDDGVLCTSDTCGSDNSCTHTDIPDCCVSNFNCYDGNVCTTDICDPATNQCQSTLDPECCVDAGDCDDGNACTTDLCYSHACRHIEAEACCNTNTECDDGNSLYH